MFARKIHAAIHLLGLTGLAISLPLSVFTTSVSIFLLALNWLLEGDFKTKYRTALERKSLLLVISIYLIFVAGLIFTRDFSYGFHDLKIKVPLLVLPLLLGTSEPLSRQNLRWILLSLITGVTIGSLASSMVLSGLVDYPFTDIREISIFVNHIRFAILIDIAVFTLAYLLLSREFNDPPWRRVLYAILFLWLIVFLVLLQSITGIMIFLGVGFILFWIYLRRINSLLMRWTLAVFMLSGALIMLAYIARFAGKFYYVEEVDRSSIDLYTENGNPYKHDFSQSFLENGNYIWLYVCERELEEQWNRISSMDYGGKDMMDQDLRFTLIRYLTSLGLRKDSAGISILTPADIQLVEQGKTNHIYGNRYSINTKLYEVFWQVDVSRKGGNPSGHSLTQRILYLKAAADIISDNLWTGVGTGDVNSAYLEYYEKINSPLEKRWRLRAHNQYLTFILTYGIFGFVWLIFAFTAPVWLERRWSDYFMIMFLLVAFSSMLNEDTLETHTGVTYFAFFYALFLFGVKPK